MTPKEKAKELRRKMYNECAADEVGDATETYRASDRAIIVADSIINELELIQRGIVSITTKIECDPSERLLFWQKVKEEITNL